MHPKVQLSADLKLAMKSKDQARVTLIRSTLAAFKDSEKRKREDRVKEALKKHGITRPTTADEAAAAAFSQAVAGALAAENIGDEVELDDAEALSLLQKLVKQRQDSISDAQKANRKDIEAAEQREMELLQAYLPQQMSRDEIEAEARAVIAQVGASTIKDMGKVMGPLMGKLQGRADGKLIGEVVRGLLA